jgi:pyrroline-5-carboxylate reductase
LLWQQSGVQTSERLIVIGGGNMGGAVLRGALAAGVLRADGVVVVEPGEEKRAGFGALGVRCVASAGEVGGFAGGVTVLLAIKPQVFAKSGVELARELGAVGRVVSVMAGVEAGSVAGVFGGARVVRTMPNLPALVGQGCTAIAAGPGAGARDVEWVERVFGAVGRVVRIDESLMDAFTALAGSGPAYLFYLAEIMRDAGIAMGMEPGDADAAARQTLAGAAAMLASSSARPEELRAGVTSPGGTTAAAIAALEAAGVKAAWMKAIAAARDRGAELAKLAREAGRG